MTRTFHPDDIPDIGNASDQTFRPSPEFARIVDPPGWDTRRSNIAGGTVGRIEHKWAEYDCSISGRQLVHDRMPPPQPRPLVDLPHWTMPLPPRPPLERRRRSMWPVLVAFVAGAALYGAVLGWLLRA